MGSYGMFFAATVRQKQCSTVRTLLSSGRHKAETMEECRTDHPAREESAFPVAAGILFRLGLGGCFDGILLHQVLQWHHMLTSAGYPADSVHTLELWS
jgi:Predicted membrane protein (DUF2243)